MMKISDLFDSAKESLTTCFKDQILKLSGRKFRVVLLKLYL